ncbi:response regulator [Aurantiacibacter odishensis]|uniref:response regulator n=1 Tax=Aurantiacibacter odishensis TaxID=1155476 RepID=UPI000E75FDDA|nr:response regulator [Aurantiacibacter odishensis]
MSKTAVSSARSGKPRKQPKLGRVLLVEDDAVLAMSLEDALLRGGAEEVIICHTMQSTMEQLEDGEKLDAIVLDVHLADRDDGWALAELVDLLGPKRPWIAFSTGSPDDIPKEIALMGPVFEKPYDPDKLVEVMAAGRKRGLFSRLLG